MTLETEKDTFQMAVTWNAFADFEDLSLSPNDVFPDFIALWRLRLRRVIDIGLSYPDDLLALKLIHQTNLTEESRKCVLAALQTYADREDASLLALSIELLKKLFDDTELSNNQAKNQNVQDDVKTDVKGEDDLQHPVENLTPTKSVRQSQTLEEENKQEFSKPRRKFDNKLLVCKLCNEAVFGMQKLQKHMDLVHGVYKCLVCDQVFERGRELKEHSLLHQKSTTCRLCCKEFDTVGRFKYHSRKCHLGGLFKCDKCDNSFQSEKHLETHNKDHVWFQCEKCGKDVFGLKNLTFHTRTHLQFKCVPCQAFFATQEKLDRHVKNHKMYSCDLCSQTFTKKFWLQRHLNSIVHGGEKRFHCNRCDKSFYRKHSLDAHKLAHDGIRNFQCDKCEKAFFTRGNLLRHLRTHTGEKPFECDICQKRFSQSGDMKKHKKMHQNLYHVKV